MEFRHGAQEIEMCRAPFGDIVVIVAVRNRAADHEQDHLAQRIHHLAGLARVLDDREMIQQTAPPRTWHNVEHGDLPNRKAHRITPGKQPVASIDPSSQNRR